jgi:hypothetical protein
MLRARAFPDQERKTRKSKFLKEARKSEKQKTLDSLPRGQQPYQVQPEKIAAFRFDQELIRRLVLRQPLPKIIAAMGGKEIEPLIHARLGDHDFRESFNEYTLGGVQRLEAEVHDSLKELQMILRLSADEMMHIALGIARRQNAKDSDRLAAVNMVMDRANALVPARVNAGDGGKSSNVFNFGADVVKEVMSAFKEMAGPQTRLVPAERTVGSMTMEERDELRQEATDAEG